MSMQDICNCSGIMQYLYQLKIQRKASQFVT